MFFSAVFAAKTRIQLTEHKNSRCGAAAFITNVFYFSFIF
jgi:hypothetical protein